MQTIIKNGYLYVYVSNESSQNVYFDDLTIKHYTGPLSQEQSYYPFGLEMAGISDKALLKQSSPYKFNGGVELEDYGLNYYNSFYRKYDPQIGRFAAVDFLSELQLELNPYQFAINNPLLFNDPGGDKAEVVPSQPTCAGCIEAVYVTGYIKKPKGVSNTDWNIIGSTLDIFDGGSGGGGGSSSTYGSSGPGGGHIASGGLGGGRSSSDFQDLLSFRSSAKMYFGGILARSFKFVNTAGNWQEAGVTNLKIKVNFVGGPESGRLVSVIIQFPLIFGLPRETGDKDKGTDHRIDATEAAEISAQAVHYAEHVTFQLLKGDPDATREEVQRTFIHNMDLFMRNYGGRVSRTGTRSPKIVIKEAEYDKSWWPF